jgi:DNA-binding CsgD family transcriptional regulator
MTAQVLLAIYYFLSYSGGISALVYATVSWILRREPLMGKFALVSLSMTLTLIASSFLNFLGADSLAAAGRFIVLANYTNAVVFSFLLVLFTTAVFELPFARAVVICVVVISILMAGALAVCARIGGVEVMGQVILMFKNAAILFTVVVALRNSAPSDKRRFRSFTRIVSFFALFFLPLLVLAETVGDFSVFFFHFRAEGPLFLPAIYGVWSVSFLVFEIRDALRPRAAGRAADGSFLTRYGISARESDVLGLLLQGKSYKGIVAELHISMPTVKSHIASLYRKTGTGNRMELSIKIASESGLLIQKNDPARA